MDSDSLNPKPHRALRFLRRSVLVAVGALALVLALFAWVGLRTGWKNPEVRTNAGVEQAEWDGELTLAAVNIAKLGFHRGGLRFRPRSTLAVMVERTAEALAPHDADIVCLSEVVSAGGPVRFDQVRELAEAGGYRYFAYVPNYDFGVPFMRISSGNAILSRLPLRDARGDQLAGPRPFWSPTNNRRALWCEVQLGDRWLPLASIRNDSFDLANNAVQVEELLATLDGRPGLIAGDFNATPDSVPGELWGAAPQLSRVPVGLPTYPAHAPVRRIDDAVWPREWELVEHGVFTAGNSDHLGVMFRWAVDG